MTDVDRPSPYNSRDGAPESETEITSAAMIEAGVKALHRWNPDFDSAEWCAEAVFQEMVAARTASAQRPGDVDRIVATSGYIEIDLNGKSKGWINFAPVAR